MAAMIELPEALTIARQLTAEVAGKKIAEAVRGNSPHKFAFYSGAPEEYARILKGRTVGEAWGRGSFIVVRMGAAHVLLLGCGGEKILYHPGAETVPGRHQLLLRFTDATFLSVTVSGWGFVQLLTEKDLAAHPHAGKAGVSPLSDGFTWRYFDGLFETAAGDPGRSVKAFMISKPGISGIGNGCLQDILFAAGIHPKRRLESMEKKDRRILYNATRSVMGEMTEKSGRDTEVDLYGNPGGYAKILASSSAGEPCTACGTKIEKIAFLGGASYFCPKCQK
jgi:formamidopyrimidine-DNA glycosylase